MLMRKFVKVMLTVATVAILTGCGSAEGSAKRGGATQGVKDILNAEMEKSSEVQGSEEVVTASSANEDSKEGFGNAETKDGIGDADSKENPGNIETKEGTGDGSQAASEVPGDGQDVSKESDTQASTETASVASEGVDVDLTALSSTMVYSEVYNMMMTPDDYLGKKVKMSGAFTYFKDENTGNEYYSCIIRDATACCAQGIEFVLAGEHKYPADYPEELAEITVVGTFDTYYEGQYRYCTLRNAELLQ